MSSSDVKGSWCHHNHDKFCQEDAGCNDCVVRRVDRNGKVLLSRNDVIMIREAAASGAYLSDIAKKYERHVSSISRIVHGESFKDYAGPVSKRVERLSDRERDGKVYLKRKSCRKTSEDDRKEITRRLVDDDEFPGVLAKEYGVSKSYVYYLKKLARKRGLL